MTKQLKRIISACLLFSMAACTSIQPVRTEPAPFISAKRPQVVYLVDHAGRVYAVEHPRVQGDSVVGLSPRLSNGVGVPLASVSSVSAAQPDHTRTALLVVVLGASGAGLVYALSHAGSGESCVSYAPGDAKVGSVAC